MLLDLIPEARREILKLLKRHGPLPVEDLAEALAITVSGARQHLAGLEKDGVVTHQRVRQVGWGRLDHGAVEKSPYENENARSHAIQDAAEPSGDAKRARELFNAPRLAESRGAATA